MGTLKVTADLLDARDDELFNLTLLTGTVSDLIADMIDREIEGEVEYYAEMTGKDMPGEWIEGIEWDFSKMYEKFAHDLPDILAEAHPDIFTTDPTDTERPVYVGPVEEASCHDPAGRGREVVMAPVRILGPDLYRMAKDAGITEVHDGRGISGFIRTAVDDYWTQIRVLEELMEYYDADSLFWTLEEWVYSDGWVGNYLEYPEDMHRALSDL